MVSAVVILLRLSYCVRLCAQTFDFLFYFGSELDIFPICVKEHFISSMREKRSERTRGWEGLVNSSVEGWTEKEIMIDWFSDQIIFLLSFFLFLT